MKKSWLSALKLKPFFCLLVVFIVFMWFTNIKKEFFLLGWDNYSSFFNLKTTIFRTLFSTWREYRGLGAPSDSEVVDLARQLFFSFFSLFLNKNLLDQVYYLFSFTVGLLGMYKLASYILFLYDKEKKYSHLTDIFSFLATFFYLFNLNSLSIFYFPIVMFVTRFYALPVLLYLFLHIINNKRITFKRILIYLVLFFLASGSFMVPTVFVATCIAFGIVVIAQKKLVKALGIFVIFLCLSAFWLFPFINYTVQKSTVVRLTPTFIDGNEGFTNKNKSYYDSQKQMIFFPQFFDMKFTDSRVWTQQYFHPLAATMNAYPNNFIALQIFPLLYIIGGLFILFKAKKKREWLWIPGILFVFLFLSMKDYSFLGFIYAFLSKNIPLFGVIFRFADTKFHAYTAFTGSLAASFACIFLYEILHKWINKKILLSTFILLFIAPTLFIFQEYFKGNLIGFFMYNKIPAAYQQIADVINRDPEDVRVVHLPVDKANYYWKPYSWGLYSSAFLNYMLDKPLFDKTFEPASQENIYIDQKINALQNNIQSVSNDTDVNKRAFEFIQLMQKIGVKYIINDETITNRINSRGIDVWGTFSPMSSDIAIKRALSLGLIKEVKKVDVNINDYKNAYSGLYPYKEAYFGDIEDKNGILPITLYEVISYDKKISFLEKTQKVDGAPLDVVEFMSSHPSVTAIQGSTQGNTIYPFLHTDNKIEFSDNLIDISVPSKQSLSNSYSLYLDKTDKISNKTYLVEVTARKDVKNLIIGLYHRYLPTINGQSFVYKLTEITIPLTQLQQVKGAGKNSVRIDGTVLPIPNTITLSEISLGAVIVKNLSFPVEVIQQYVSKNVDMGSFITIPNLNCYKDALGGYTYSIINKDNAMTIASTNGSVCLQSSLKPLFDSKTTHAEFEFDTKGISEDLDKQSGYTTQSETTKPILKNIITSLPKPQHLKVCIKEASFDDCYNTHDVQIGEPKHTILPTEKNTDNMLEPMLFLALRSMEYQKQSATIGNLKVNLFETKLHKDVEITPFEPNEKAVITQPQGIHISFPLSRSSESYYYKSGTDSFYFYNTPCHYYRTFRKVNDRIISYVEQCDNTLFIDLPYSTNNFYIWEVRYNLGAGQYPYFIMEDTYSQYVNERISLNQGYPDIKSFKNLQGPEFFMNPEEVKNTLLTLPSVQAYTYIYPQPDVPDTKRKSFFIKQFTENEGIFALDSYNVAEVPNMWSKLALEPENSKREYSQPPSYTFNSILPSLWKVKVSAHSEVSLLKFNEGYDTQWGLYEGIGGVLFGKEKAVHYKCDGLTNCFEISPEQADKTYFIFYWPEKLSFFGWIITFLAVIFAFFWARRPLKVDK